ncbi:OmpA family protein [Rhodococcus sp. D2-41]|uniref:OmpA family protein n=1 Tax=Speluncibacter jeojiensis TaxID=2710754 RepID=A0A9X4RED2_9ACTN|nr:OmpA family protein [Rhodococcus sp. D2-41]MDG3011561.1 OmpA family protein [Rhodococcus sp. D2-41]MDG3015082.1 OmpA family protein [Corynebacteriales bacterium D3-21]
MPGGARGRMLIGAAVVVGAVLAVAGCSVGDSVGDPPFTSAVKTSSVAVSPSGAASGGAASGGPAPTVGDPGGNTQGKQLQGAIDAIVSTSPIAFDVDSAELTTLDVGTLKAVAAVLEGNGRAVVVKTFAHGHTDDPVAARSLAHQRGQAVVEQLEDNGVDMSRLTVEASVNPPDGVDPDRALVTVGSR